jgi:TetR/AcrR family transcriptional regulator, transcriptional repressor for nem operon
MTRAAAVTPAEPDTAQRILDIASRLVQTRGFNGFSYAHIAAELGVTKASLHYHYPSKAELGKRLIERYEQEFAAALEHIEAETDDAFLRLQRYARIYAGVLGKEQMCLCGMLAAEHGTLPAPMRRTLQHYFDLNEAWLAKVLDGGRRRGQLRFDGPPREVAALLVGALEGAMMMARSYGDPRRFATAAERLLADMRTDVAPARKAARR